MVLPTLPTGIVSITAWINEVRKDPCVIGCATTESIDLLIVDFV